MTHDGLPRTLVDSLWKREAAGGAASCAVPFPGRYPLSIKRASAADGVALHAARVGGGFEHPAFGGRFAGAAREALGCTPPSPNVKYFYRESPHRPRSRMSEAASRKKIAAPWSRPAATSAVIGAIWSHPEGPRAAVAEFNEVFVAISSSLARARAGGCLPECTNRSYKSNAGRLGSIAL